MLRAAPSAPENTHGPERVIEPLPQEVIIKMVRHTPNKHRDGFEAT